MERPIRHAVAKRVSSTMRVYLTNAGLLMTVVRDGKQQGQIGRSCDHEPPAMGSDRERLAAATIGCDRESVAGREARADVHEWADRTGTDPARDRRSRTSLPEQSGETGQPPTSVSQRLEGGRPGLCLTGPPRRRDPCRTRATHGVATTHDSRLSVLHCPQTRLPSAIVSTNGRTCVQSAAITISFRESKRPQILGPTSAYEQNPSVVRRHGGVASALAKSIGPSRRRVQILQDRQALVSWNKDAMLAGEVTHEQ
jgi:hypothetical protein